jgi:hypothetical protein
MSRSLIPLVAAALIGCSTEHDSKPQAAMAAIASGSLAVRPAPAPEPPAPREPEKPIVQRPKDAADLMASAQKRARVEAFAPEAKGFLTSADLEEKLYKLGLRRGKDEDAVKALDSLAKGKWVLFTGNIGGIDADKFQLPIRYTPKDLNDPLGLTSVWVPITLSGIKGYDATQYQPGELAVVLAHYDGKQHATAGYDVVMLGHWFEEASAP